MILCFLMWLYILFIVIWNICFGSTKNFSKKKLSMQETLLGSNFLTTVSEEDNGAFHEIRAQLWIFMECEHSLFQFFTLSSTVLPIVMLVMYGIIFLVIIKKRGMLSGNSGSSEKDRSLLWQALAVSVMLEVSSACMTPT